MKTELLKKIRKDYSIVEYIDPDGLKVARVLHKGKRVDYWWIDQSESSYRSLILLIAYWEFYKYRDFETFSISRGKFHLREVAARLCSDRTEITKNRLNTKRIKNAIKIWP
jgi:hypothetical protein